MLIEISTSSSNSCCNFLKTLQQDGNRAWLVFDHEAIENAPQILSARRWTFDEYLELFNSHDFFYKADTVEGLGEAAGFDAKGLVATVAEYNAGQGRGHDKLGRKHLPAPIAKPPYYSILTHSWSFVSFGGVAVDDDLRVIRPDNTPIQGLYAAGEAIGAGQTQGRSQCGGMCLTPALTFGRLLGQKMLKFAA